MERAIIAPIAIPMLLKGMNEMPAGVYVRSEEVKAAMKGRKTWNKGVLSISNQFLLDETNGVIVSSYEKLTIKEIHETLARKGIVPLGHNEYERVRRNIANARKNGKLPNDAVLDEDWKKLASRPLPKFKVGDKVRITGSSHQTPLWLRRELRLNNCRTIVKVLLPAGSDGHFRYFLGSNGLGKNYLEFRAFKSTELEFYCKKTTSGRPSKKRKYTKRCKDTSPVQGGLSVNPSGLPSILCVNLKNELVGVC